MAPAKKTSTAKTKATEEPDSRAGRKKGEYVRLGKDVLRNAVERYIEDHPGVTQKALYEELGVSASTWARLMSNAGRIHRTQLQLAIQLLGPFPTPEGWDREIEVSWVVLEKLDRIEALLRSIASPGVTPEAQAEARALLDQAARTLGLESAQLGELRSAPGRLRERQS